MENLFVYGTLKKGGCRYSALKGVIQLGEGQTLEHFAMFDTGDFPIVTEDEVNAIHGEVYRIDEEKLKHIDILESNRFDRISISVKMKDSGTVDAWMYVCVDEDLDGILIREGKWR